MNLTTVDRRLAELEKQSAERSNHNNRQELIDGLCTVSSRQSPCNLSPGELEMTKAKLDKFFEDFRKRNAWT